MTGRHAEGRAWWDLEDVANDNGYAYPGTFLARRLRARGHYLLHRPRHRRTRVTPAEHYAEAERLLDLAIASSKDRYEAGLNRYSPQDLVATAHAHAALASSARVIIVGVPENGGLDAEEMRFLAEMLNDALRAGG